LSANQGYPYSIDKLKSTEILDLFEKLIWVFNYRLYYN
jgi:hypothetical protein